MDRKTLAAYDQDAAAFAKDWHDQPAPVDLQEVVERFFVRGGTSADIGCGSGREVAWLNANGFSAAGFDASEGLLNGGAPALSRLQVRACRIARAARHRPRFDNVLCETVIMHLDRKQIAAVGPPPARYRQAQRHSLSELARHRERRSARRPGPALCGVRCRAGAGGTEGRPRCCSMKRSSAPPRARRFTASW